MRSRVGTQAKSGTRYIIARLLVRSFVRSFDRSFNGLLSDRQRKDKTMAKYGCIGIGTPRL